MKRRFGHDSPFASRIFAGKVLVKPDLLSGRTLSRVPWLGSQPGARSVLAPVLHFALLEQNSLEELPSPATPLPEIAAWTLQQAEVLCLGMTS